MATAHLSDEQLSAHLDGVIEGGVAAAVGLHLDECEACAHRLQMLRATSQAVASLPDEEPPRPLDLAFLHSSKVPPVPRDGHRRFWPRVVPGRVSTWGPTAVAAAAVLALAITWAPRLSPASAPTASTAGSSRQALKTGAGTASPSAAVVNQYLAPVGGAAVPNAAFAGDATRRSVTGADGSTVTILANPPGDATGHPVQLLLRVVGGPKGTNLAAPGMEIFVAQGQNQLRLAGSEGTTRTLKPGEELDLTVEWTAGAVSGPPAPGTYSVVGRVFLEGGRLVEVTIPYAVSG